MKLQTTTPTGSAQTFDVHETFFSTTDARGVITSGNQVFCRTSGYTLEEMTGQPHNLIRHPDMPRVVFRRLWETVRAGRLFMGYVKNQARNGNHYWVFAVIVPLASGYLSVRIKPTSRLAQRIESVYRQLLDAENEALAAGASEGQAANRAATVLDDLVQALGFSDYASFSHHALNTEIKSRDAEVARRGLRLFSVVDHDTARADMQLARLSEESLRAYEGIVALFSALDAFSEACGGIREHQKAVQTIAEDFRLNALNAHIAANPLGAAGLTLGTVAQVLNTHGQSLSRNVATLAQSILRTTTAVADISSNLSASRIQIEMLLSFLGELASAASRGDATVLRRRVEDLRHGFSSTMEHAFRALEALQRQLAEVMATKKQLRRDIIFLQVAQISGLTEVSRLPNADGLHATFLGLRDQIETGKSELGKLDEVVDQLNTLTLAAPAKVGAIQVAMRQMREAAGG